MSKKIKHIGILTGAGLGASVGIKNSFRDTIITAPVVIGGGAAISKIATGKWNVGKIAKYTSIVAGSYIAAATITGAVVGIGGAATINEFVDEFIDDDEEMEEEC